MLCISIETENENYMMYMTSWLLNDVVNIETTRRRNMYDCHFRGLIQKQLISYILSKIVKNYWDILCISSSDSFINETLLICR
jgi:hypothetical protein